MSELLDKVNKTLSYYAAGALRRWRGGVYALTRPQLERPVVVLGCSRAGTTLVYKTLSRSPELGSLNRETHDLWEALHPLAERDWDSHVLTARDASPKDLAVMTRLFYTHTGRRRIVDKNNQNGLCVDYLQALFPDAHFVYVKRSPGDNINSLIEGWRRPEEFATWSHGLPCELEIGGGEFRRWCFFLSPGWRQHCQDPIGALCAWQYRSINEAILDAGSRIDPGRWTEIRYEDLVKEPVQGFRQAFESAGLAFGPALEAHCRGVLQRPYNAFSEIRLDKWRDGRNREQVEAVLDSVADVAARMGYQAAAESRKT